MIRKIIVWLSALAATATFSVTSNPSAYAAGSSGTCSHSPAIGNTFRVWCNTSREYRAKIRCRNDNGRGYAVATLYGPAVTNNRTSTVSCYGGWKAFAWGYVILVP